MARLKILLVLFLIAFIAHVTWMNRPVNVEAANKKLFVGMKESDVIAIMRFPAGKYRVNEPNNPWRSETYVSCTRNGSRVGKSVYKGWMFPDGVIIVKLDEGSVSDVSFTQLDDGLLESTFYWPWILIKNWLKND